MTTERFFPFSYYLDKNIHTAERTNYVRTLNQVALWQNQKQETHSTLSALSQALVAAALLGVYASLLRRGDTAISNDTYATCVADRVYGFTCVRNVA